MTTQNVERRAFGTLEIRADGDGKTQKLVGHAAVFNQLSEDLGGFREKIDPGAFDETLERDDVVALWNHDANFVLGRKAAGTLTLAKDAVGLAVEITPPDSQGAQDLVASIKRGDVRQMSFGFRTLKDSWERILKDGGQMQHIRTLEKVQLFDVSPVTFPAYPQTDIAARSLADWSSWQGQRAAKIAASSRRRALDLLELGV